ncbi:tRNA (adenosine(37)-N6)-dimethylallyltransferase MiaA [Leuconostoc suionicum]|uniref:tRNA (adenosine(37)-N6)-dimethylallyltransferase MiaA n=1 Tax=Leuconostoc suionicum TaxID=1511761 RepID=UPI0021AA4FA1|nr:tRNA (adenosine(37)-N6)-dimethylallyltransferase MiaA [Leuconostoc suionicum]MCT4382851.1 tRNA (adenosine(37)-N6)-dimethylallyltransferase MiaA [Leuconostoc suionicum]MDC2806675.1 tRNA (adenosine(37)-N6)-dimethylallyltransferase MiaA [Leuconostoc suionicum]MDC2824187.1 tRNA (adenosine(37)-N6)-dimethylallyltransferase MiaA [Leuconostoc suionicum]
MNKIVVLTGPTASGKSSLSIQMAQRFNGEIVSADSMQIYRSLDIGTAKVTKEEQNIVPHHLIDIVDLIANYSVGDFIIAADKVIADIISRGKLPIIVGGTGLYVKALLGFQELEYAASDTEEVHKLNAYELEKLVVELKSLDINRAQKVDLKNKQRVIRAIQIAKHGKKDVKLTQRPKYDALVIGLDWPRELLYERINNRVTQMVQDDVLKEAQTILDAGGEELQSGKAIGYKEFFPYLRNQVTLDKAINQLQQDSRRYAKRQLTYLRHQIPGLVWLKGQTAEIRLTEMIEGWLSLK